MIRDLLLTFSACLYLLCGHDVARASDPAAVVLDVRGSVLLMPPRNASPTQATLVVPLAQLPAGARLRLPASGSITVFHLAGGKEWTAIGPGTVDVGALRLDRVEGPAPTSPPVPPGKEIRLRGDHLDVFGVVLNSGSERARIGKDVACPLEARPGTPVHCACAKAPPADLPAQHAVRPGARFASRVLHALWLDEICAGDAALEAWRSLALERPDAALILERTDR
jgi:hypothetical protein